MNVYELWDKRSNNMVLDWDLASDAEDSLLEVVRGKGDGILKDHALVAVDDQDETSYIAEDEAILVAVKRLAAGERTATSSASRYRVS